MQRYSGVLSLSGFFAAFIGLGLTGASLGPTLPSLAAVAGVTLAQIGLLLFSRSLGEMAGCLCAGLAADRGHGRAVLVISMVLMLGSLTAIPASRSLMRFAALFLLLGVGQGAQHTVINTWLVWRDPGRAQARLSMLHFNFGVGAMLAPLFVAWFLPLRSDGLSVYWFLAVAAAVLLLPLATRVRTEPPSADRSLSSRPVSRARLGWAVVLFFVYVGGEASIGGWLFTHASRAVGFTDASAAYLVAAFWGSFTLGRLMAAFVSARIPPARYVFGSLAASVLCSVGLLVFPHGGALLWIAVAGLGLSVSAVFPQAFSVAGAALGLSGSRNAWLLVASSAGAMTVPALTGWLMESISVHALPAVAAVSFFFAFVAFVRLRLTS